MKVLFITIGLCFLIFGGCTQQLSNDDAMMRILQERTKYGNQSNFNMSETNRYGRDSSDFGPKIDIKKTIWGD